jgi:hypothetical protein
MFTSTTGLNAVFDQTGVESSPGPYALLLSSATDQLICVGRLGDLRLQPGFYVYVGSPLGTGGVRARLAHHIRAAERPHWHIGLSLVFKERGLQPIQ